MKQLHMRAVSVMWIRQVRRRIYAFWPQIHCVFKNRTPETFSYNFAKIALI